MKFFPFILLTLIALAGCARNDVDPNSVGRSGELETASYTAADGTVFRFEYRYDTWIKDYGLHIDREGQPMTKDDGPLAQNTIRAFFRSNICSEGFHPGLTSLVTLKNGRFGARLFCSTKKQEDVPL